MGKNSDRRESFHSRDRERPGDTPVVSGLRRPIRLTKSWAREHANKPDRREQSHEFRRSDVGARTIGASQTWSIATSSSPGQIEGLSTSRRTAT